MMLILLTLACGQDISVTETAKCDGVLQASEDWVDQPFDKDEDGYPDGGNAECQEAYAAEDLDCDDNNIDISPSAVEVGCNLLDDDCDAATLDEEDRDEDTFTSCEECDDFNADVNPLAEEVLCNGLDDDCDPASEDAVDLDGDLYSECDLDCNDEDANVNPGVDEVVCNGVDDDCSETTPDGEDFDGDGVTECSDCDDDDSLNWPGNDELCDDGQDNDCDTLVDETCASDYSGTWTLDTVVDYQCALVGMTYYVNLSFLQLDITDASPIIRVDPVSSNNTQPGAMAGEFSSGTEFTSENVNAGGCTETYNTFGTFTNSTTMEGTFTAKFTGGCLDCTNQSVSFTATR